MATGAALTATTALEGCALGEHGAQSTTDTVEKTADNPFGLADKGNVELVWFKGGSPAYLPDAVDPLFRKKHPDVRIERRSTERMSQTLQPRFVGGNPPDYVDNSGADSLDVGVPIQDGQVLDLTALYEAPSLDDPKKTVKETLLPGAYEDTLVDGRPYSLAYYSRGFGLWYDAHFFEGKGWQVPDTWSAFLTLCEQIKEAGVIPYGFAGKNAADYHSNVLLTSAAKLGGPEILRAVDNLEPHAWEAAAIKKAAEVWAHVGAKELYEAAQLDGAGRTPAHLLQHHAAPASQHRSGRLDLPGHRNTRRIRPRTGLVGQQRRPRRLDHSGRPAGMAERLQLLQVRLRLRPRRRALLHRHDDHCPDPALHPP
ncbi:extracellular solute-binding protein [Streptomyces sp. NPDC048641]|uniref:extracellular solute-binding protein n=1 Tax=Streptomyces sp. NPDC048641 TaxID=3154825 RepID=UPI0034419CB3